LATKPRVVIVSRAGPSRLGTTTTDVSAYTEQAAAEMKHLIPEVRAEYSQVCQLIRLLLVSPAASAQAEYPPTAKN